MKLVFPILIAFFLLSSCMNDGQNQFEEVEKIIETATSVEEPTPSPEEEEGKQQLVFYVDGNEIILDIKRIPILREFLKGKQMTDEVVTDIQMEKIDTDAMDIYTLRFSCVNDRCSYILFSEEHGKQPFLVADMANYVNSYISPDESKLALQFNRFLGTDTVTLSNLIVIDTVNWELLSISSEESSISLLNYNWPYVSVEWVNDESIAISIPDLIELNKDTYDEWSAAEKHSVTTILYSITKEE